MEGKDLKDEKRMFGVPVYLDTRRVYDLLAEVDDGFYHLEMVKVTTQEADSLGVKSQGHAGLSNLLASFVNVGFEVEGGAQAHNESGQEITRQRIHTPTSLFAKARQRLLEREIVQRILADQDLRECTQGSFVEFKVILQLNPYLRRLQRFLQYEELNAGFNAIESPNSDKSEMELRAQLNQATRALVKKTIEGLRQSDYVEIIGFLRDTNIRVVAAANLKYFIDDYQTQINDGEFTIFGKVIKVLSSEGEKIDLLRNTPLGHNEIDLLEGHIKILEDAGVEFPEVVTEIKPPAIQVFPIAIFV